MHSYLTMRIFIRELRAMIHETAQGIDQSYRRLRVVDTTPQESDREKPEGSVSKGLQTQENDIEEEIEEMRKMPEFADIDAFAAAKLDDDDLTYSFMELQALARNLASLRTKNRAAVAGKSDIDTVRNALESEIGFKYVPRQPVRQTRGVASSAHGTHPFAGSGGSGSGFSTSRDGGGGFTSYGGGPGAIGGGYAWDPEDKKNLSMGARRRA